ncbi:MFS transporter [Aquisalimonas asiatica]|uniref:MFS transporter, YNFM family, putative membrane transport protein n=1 Tax=Aquisalimonas asiatica TaxID=406100 RepID=A0A1H8QKJ4_9GAMM|nr:MFS transporter [Aquisalimonas asiatica]SEO54739.1 MFS transporter, YNFM family, putative membrane transport protein [Aquisalimonas asiatica]
MTRLLVATVLVFCALYAPQPLLPLLADLYGVSETRAALLITATLLPLSIAPILYGLWLERLSARRVLAGAVALLGVSQIVFALADSFTVLLVARIAQGILIPAALTALMTFIAGRVAAERLAATMAAYVAATVLGGFLGRALAGLISAYWSWEAAFWLLGGGLLALTPLLLRLDGDQPPNAARINWRTCREVFARPGVAATCLIGFSVFFVFAALLTYLPFRAVQLRPETGEDTIALLYAGYLMGIVVALASGRITRWSGSARATVRLGLGVFLLATLGFLVPSLPALFAVMLVFCGGMFLVHGTAPGIVNALAPDRRGVVNGLYIAAYYAGGTLGAWLPGILYAHIGWAAMVSAVALMLLVATAASRGLPGPHSSQSKAES